MCFWRAGQAAHARSLLAELSQAHPDEHAAIQEVLDALAGAFPAQAS